MIMKINIKHIQRVAKWGFASLFSIVGIFFLLFLSSEWWCPEFWGSQNVGKNLYLLHWERDTYQFVYSTDVHGRTCYHGAPIIPSYKNDEYANTFVKKWGYTDKWIALIAYNFTSSRNKYFIVEKNYDTDAKDTLAANKIRDEHITQITDSAQFIKECKLHGINIVCE